MFNVEVNQYKRIHGGSSVEHSDFMYYLPGITQSYLKSFEGQLVEYFRLKGDIKNFRSGIPNERLIIFSNGIPENNYTEIMPDVFWVDEYFELYIGYDIFEIFNEDVLDALKNILSQLEVKILAPKLLQYSWLHSQDKEALIKRVEENFKRTRERNFHEEVQRIAGLENDVESKRRQLKSLVETLAQKRRFVQTEQENLKNISQQLLKDLDLIAQNPKVKDLQIKDNYIHVYTKLLNIHNEKGEVFKGSEYHIKLDPHGSDVRIYGENKRRSYWSPHDPHPHVDGNSGRPCLGSANEAVAELSAQGQLYALTMVIIDFLENAYTQDCAGTNVYHWDMINEHGEIIREGGRLMESDDGDELSDCECCEERFYDGDLHVVYDDADEDGTNGEHYVCGSCRDRRYRFHEPTNEYLTEDAGAFNVLF